MTTASIPGRHRRPLGGAGVLPGAGGRAAGQVACLDSRRIQDALRARRRYKYVQPRVLREGKGWKIVSPNCSRNIDAEGGEIDIAWLVPDTGGAGWLLFSRDHAQDCWLLRHRETTLAAALAHLSADPRREFWQ